MDWVAIRAEYETTDITLKALADKYGAKDATIRSRKNREKWQRNDEVELENAATQPQRNEIKMKAVADSEDLTEKQRLFCLHYLKSFNATQSAIKAGYSKESAHVQGARLLNNDKIRSYIRELKEDMASQLFVSASDVLNTYAKIAFADITEYITFDSFIRYERDEDGGIRLDDEDNPITYQVSQANFVSSEEVDGTLITEVKQGKDGVSIKLADKMKALEKLEQYFDLLPDKHKRQVEDEKLNIARAKLKIDEQKAAGDTTTSQESEVAKMLQSMVNQDGT